MQGELLGSAGDGRSDDTHPSPALRVVHARFLRSEPFRMDLFDGFTRLRVLTYSAGIPMVLRMLQRFNEVECVFGSERVIAGFDDLLAFQQICTERLVRATLDLKDGPRSRLRQAVAENRVRFFVVRGAVSHSKVYLLDGPTRRRVVVGSANLSDVAFSGAQAETLQAFDEALGEKGGAWDEYEAHYRWVREQAASPLKLRADGEGNTVAIEELPVFREAEAGTGSVTVFLGPHPEAGSGTRPLHVVAADNSTEGETIVITVYQPDPALWEADFTRRRER